MTKTKKIEDADRPRMDDAIVTTGTKLDLLVEHYGERSVTKTIWPSLMGAILAVAAASKNKYVAHVIGGKTTPLNLYGVLVADTGDGKEMVQTILSEAAAFCGFGVSGHVTSSAALHYGIKQAKEHGFTIVKDELGLMLQHARSSPGHHLNDFWRMLLECYGRANGTLLARTYGDAKKCLEAIERPFVNAAFMTTPDTFIKGLNVGDVNDGSLNRPIVFSGGRAEKKAMKSPTVGEPVTVTKGKLPDALGQALTNISTGVECSPQAQGKVAEIRAADEMTARSLENLYDECFDMTQTADAFLWKRAYENIIKVAALLALFDAAYAAGDNDRLKESDLNIRLQHVKYAERLVVASVNWVKRSISDEFGKTDGDKFLERCKKQIDALALSGGDYKGWARKGDVVKNLKNTRHRSKEVRDDIQELVDLGYLKSEQVVFTTGARATELLSYERSAVLEVF